MDINIENKKEDQTIRNNILNGGFLCNNTLRKDINSRISDRVYFVSSKSYLAEPMYFDFNLQNNKKCFEKYINSKQTFTNHPYLDTGYQKF